MTDFDLLIAGGEVVDGTGAPPFRANLAIKAGRIAEIIPHGALDAQVAAGNPPALDARGLLVAPGFIDIHSHSDFTLLADPRAVSSVTQGVTLEVIGNCGHGCAPLVDPELAKSNIYGYQAGYPIGWRSMAGYLEQLEAGRPAVNVLTLVPNGNLRLAVAGALDRPSTPDEVRRMQRLLAQSLEEGAFGFSTGLEYGPERACSESEIVALCEVAAHAGALYATHTRNRPGEAYETIAEAIRTAEAANLPLQISHISVVARLAEDGRRAVEQALEQVDAACARGLDVGFDMHTRLFGTTNLTAALPPWALEGDRAAVAARLRDPALRRELCSYRSIITALARDDWSRIVLFDSRATRAGAQEHRRDQRGARVRSARYDLRHSAGRDRRYPCPNGDRVRIPRARHPSGLRATRLYGRLRRDRARARWTAGGHLIPWRIYLGRLVLPPLRARNRHAQPTGSRAPPYHTAGQPAWAGRPRPGAHWRASRPGDLRPRTVRRARYDLRAESDRHWYAPCPGEWCGHAEGWCIDRESGWAGVTPRYALALRQSSIR